MNCPTCRNPLEPNARFCGVCGHRVSAERSSNPPILPQPSVSASMAIAPPTVVSPPPMMMAAPTVLAPAVTGSADPFIGQLLNNRFRIESKIGEGGFGAVYRGTQLATGRKVAVKVLHPEMTADENLVARFRREGMVLCNLRDAHTITTYDFDQTSDGTLYIAMELLEGRSLHDVFHSNPPLEWKRMFRILAAMCSSLAEAHAQGIIHRDLKPENVYLEQRMGDSDYVKILDFGIAKVMRGDSIDPASPQLTATGQTLGTLEYMSPEQLMGKPLDGRSDVYALGVLGYEMITGRLPFPDAKGPAGLITAQLKQTPVAPSVANGRVGIPPVADAVLLRCLEKDKNQRFLDVRALAEALQAALQAPPPAARPRAATPPAPLPLPLSHSAAPSAQGLLPGVAARSPSTPSRAPSPAAPANGTMLGVGHSTSPPAPLPVSRAGSVPGIQTLNPNPPTIVSASPHERPEGRDNTNIYLIAGILVLLGVVVGLLFAFVV